MDPIHFARALSLYEARLFIAGLNRRYRAGWEQARLAAFYAARPHLKDFEFGNMPTFSWEDEKEADPRSEEEKLKEIEALRAYALERDKDLLKMKENGKG